jgi:hypothetical protein
VIIVVCQEGFQSSLAAAALQRLGLRNATDLDGGFAAWRGLACRWCPEPEVILQICCVLISDITTGPDRTERSFGRCIGSQADSKIAVQIGGSAHVLRDLIHH